MCLSYRVKNIVLKSFVSFLLLTVIGGVRTIHAKEVFLAINIEVDIKDAKTRRILEYLKSSINQQIEVLRNYLRTNFSAEEAYDLEEVRKFLSKEGKSLLLALISSEGYLGVQIGLEFVESKKKFLYSIYLGPLYKVSDIWIKVVSPQGVPMEELFPNIEYLDLKVKKGAVVDIGSIFESEKQIFDYIDKQFSYLYKTVFHKIVKINHQLKTVSVEFLVELSQSAVIKNIEIHGLQNIEYSFVENLIDIKPNTPFSQNIVNQALERLNSSNLFSDITTIIPPEVGSEGDIKMKFYVQEAAHRKIYAFSGYNMTSRSFDLYLGYYNNNLFNKAQSMGISLGLSDINFFRDLSPFLQINYAHPFFKKGDISFYLESLFQKDPYRVLDSSSIKFSGGVKYWMRQNIITDYGLQYLALSQSYINTQKFRYFAFPLQFNINVRNFFFHTKFTPFLAYSLFRKKEVPGHEYKSFNKLDLSIGSNLNLEDRLYCLCRAHLGRFFYVEDHEIHKIPISEMHFLGSEHSIRGYKNVLFLEKSKLSELQKSKNLFLGGLYFINLSTELKVRLSKNFFFGPYIDFAITNNQLSDDTSSKKYTSLGVSMTYDTKIIPIKFDIAFPLDKREGIDTFFAIYFNIGTTI